LDHQQKHFLTKIINIEYPDLHVSLHGGFVRVKESTKEANNEILQKKKDQAELIIQKGIGFRRLTDALTGDLASLPTKSFADLLTTTTSFTLEELACALKEHLRVHRATLVGHNCFTDLVFLYHHFIGKLPETVDEFQILFHQVFPQVIDTKYLYTSHQGCNNAHSSLSEACKQMASVTSPTICMLQIILHPIFVCI
jgi:poly(A)-specific ribonuclease